MKELTYQLSILIKDYKSLEKSVDELNKAIDILKDEIDVEYAIDILSKKLSDKLKLLNDMLLLDIVIVENEQKQEWNLYK